MRITVVGAAVIVLIAVVAVLVLRELSKANAPPVEPEPNS